MTRLFKATVLALLIATPGLATAANQAIGIDIVRWVNPETAD